MQLNAIYSELEENSNRLDPVIEFYHLHENLRSYLYTIIKNPEQYSSDSINKYRKVISYNQGFSYKHAAFDMFVNSGAMKMMVNRNQLLEITECYAMLEEFKISVDNHLELKAEIFSNTYKMDRKKIFEEDYDIRDSEWNMQFNFHTLNNGMEGSAVTIKQELEKVLAKVKKQVD